MHIVFRESHGLEETETPFDPGQDPADLVVLSFSDSDLGAFAAAWHQAQAAGRALPSLRLVNLAALRHPVSVDNYAEATLRGAKAVLVRLIGGEAYWAYGLTSLQTLARETGLHLAILPGDGRPDPALDALSTLPIPALRELARLCEMGGAAAAEAALARLAQEAGLNVAAVPSPPPLPECGLYLPGAGAVSALPAGAGADVPVIFYRSYLTAADTGPIDALIPALTEAGFNAYGLFVPSLKAPAAADWVARHLAARPPAAIVNATAFSATGETGATPLDGPGAPVFQVALSTALRRDWEAAARGLSPADLAMHVALPEIDGRLFAGVVSFKSSGKRDESLQYSRFTHRAVPERVAAVAAKVAAWHRLAVTPAPARNFALVLSTYPGRPDQMAHAVGLDTLASANALLEDLRAGGYTVAPVPELPERLRQASLAWPLTEYRTALAQLPEPLRAALAEAWGAPEDDPLALNGAFHFQAVQAGRALVALQPERGQAAGREGAYHDLAATPCHGYVAFYLWLRGRGLHALVHMGAHGTLEWLPGKAVALSAECWPEALIGPLPVIYPFIVNDPGEAAQAKRRTGAVTIGHLPPPLAEAGLPEGLTQLEALLDEYATAEGLDPPRRNRLISAIREEAQARGIEQDLGLPPEASLAEAVTRIDRFVCDLKESRFGEGLHIFGRGECGAEERAGLLAALAGRRVPPGPSGSPARGRRDVLPTGRNMFAVDPRAVPTPAAHAQGVKLAEELLRKHLQDQGDWPKGLLVDLWGSATMRTAGEDFAMALHLAGLAPRWQAGGGRVDGFEILPLAMLGRPRIDVTLRVSGLFRDIFPQLAQLFEAGAAALAARGEDPADNPYAQPAPRVFGPKPGAYGLNMGAALDEFSPEARGRAAEAWLTGSGWSIGADGQAREDLPALEARLAGTDGFVHAQDLPETDLLLATDYAAHEGGFAAAMAHLGHAAPALYHLDVTRPDQPCARNLPEEIARVVRARAANPAWAEGMMAHGFRGGAEIAATLDHMAAFAHLANAVPAHLFDLYHEATLGRPEVVSFLARENPAALARLHDVFHRLRAAGLWCTLSNAIAASLEGGA
ncbi:MAG: cobaltochelatase subunit CobN [Acidocella sp.]|uniref:cobaltochelatase subunit CobN n=1 Tax=Acidocella sp. TaxID=50710 RepID=UPI003FBDC148